MSEQVGEATKKRGPGRPRKHPLAEARAPLPAPIAAHVADPLAPLVTDRAGAGKIIGLSAMSIKRKELDDPTWPKPFAVGSYRHCYLIADIHAWVINKAREAQSA